jgi:antitoxin component of MazEF toxin-antitoxin module
MKETFLRAIRKTGTSLGVNIPPEVIKLLGLKEDSIIRITVEKIKKGDKD